MINKAIQQTHQQVWKKELMMYCAVWKTQKLQFLSNENLWVQRELRLKWANIKKPFDCLWAVLHFNRAYT
jgi:hypothetical protein